VLHVDWSRWHHIYRFFRLRRLGTGLFLKIFDFCELEFKIIGFQGFYLRLLFSARGLLLFSRAFLSISFGINTVSFGILSRPQILLLFRQSFGPFSFGLQNKRPLFVLISVFLHDYLNWRIQVFSVRSFVLLSGQKELIRGQYLVSRNRHVLLKVFWFIWKTDHLMNFIKLLAFCLTALHTFDYIFRVRTTIAPFIVVVVFLQFFQKYFI